jgi:hypothetical protein
MDYRAYELGYDVEPVIRTDDALRPMDDLMQYVKEYSRQRPEVVAFACFGIGFILGWKLKPW